MCIYAVSQLTWCSYVRVHSLVKCPDVARVHDGPRRLARPAGQARLDRYFVLSGAGCGCGLCTGPLRTKHGLLREAHSVRRSGRLKLDGMALAAATHADDC